MRRLETDESSNVRAIEYDAARQQLYVTFAAGTRYRYDAVAPETFAAACGAPSIGRWVHAELVAKRVAYRKDETNAEHNARVDQVRGERDRLLAVVRLIAGLPASTRREREIVEACRQLLDELKLMVVSG